MDTDSTGAAERQVDLWDRLNDMETKILQAKHLTEVLWMAGESITDTKKKNAITAQCDVIDGLLREALDIRDEVSAAVRGRSA